VTLISIRNNHHQKIPLHSRILNSGRTRNACLTSTSVRCVHATSSSFQQKKYYEILGVPKNASSKEIKKAYYQLAKKFHPDTNKGDSNCAKKFQEVSEAYEVLSDDTKRREFDTWGQTSEQMGRNGTGPGPGHPGAGAGFGGGQQSWNFHSSMDPEELFRKIFGSAGFGGAGRNPFGDTGSEDDFAESPFGFGGAQEIVMNLTFQQAARGVNKEVLINVTDTCPKCTGSRCEPGTKPVKCDACNGTGMETVATGPFIMRTTCRHCRGTRTIIKQPCNECGGKGTVVQRKRVTVPIPAGVEDGQTVRMPVAKKEVFITFRVEKSDYFRRDGPDVHSDVNISLAQAILGGATRVQGIYENLTVDIPAGTGSHTRIRLKGKGIRKVNGFGQGDHYVHLKIKVPARLTDEQQALIRAYAELEDDTPGTVTGITNTKSGLKKCTEDSDLLSRIKKVLTKFTPGAITGRKETSKIPPQEPTEDEEVKVKAKQGSD